ARGRAPISGHADGLRHRPVRPPARGAGARHRGPPRRRRNRAGVAAARGAVGLPRYGAGGRGVGCAPGYPLPVGWRESAKSAARPNAAGEGNPQAICRMIGAMRSQIPNYPHHPLRNVRLDTLIRLRWLAVFGQAAAVLVVNDGLDFELPVWPCLAVIGLYAWLNVALRLRFRGNERLEPDRYAWLLAVDIAELAILLFLTGGLQNPFAFLFLGPVLISATALPARMTSMLAGFAMVCATVLMFIHYPLPWSSEDPLELPQPYMIGVWLALLLCIGYISVYAWQIIEESRQLAEALA